MKVSNMSVNGEVLKVGETMTITSVTNNDDTNGFMIKNPKWLPINSGIDFSSDADNETITFDRTKWFDMVDKKDYDALKKKIERVNNYLDAVLKYNASARLEAVICVVKDILNGSDK